MLKYSAKLTNAKQAAIKSSATPKVLKNIFFGEIRNEVRRFYEIAKRNAFEYPEQPSGRLASAVRMDFVERKYTLTGSVIVDQRVAPYAEFVELGHFAGPKESAKRTWVPGLFYMESAFLEVRADSRRRVESGIQPKLRWYDNPNTHRGTGQKLSIL